jgi:DtxR family Mn-dependent transcriptional regulator
VGAAGAGEGRMSEQLQYLLGLYIAQHRGSGRVSPSRVGELIDRSPATVIEALRAFEEEGWVEYESYDGATLTETGRMRAEELHETYVTLSWFFRRTLDLENYEREALAMASQISPEVAERLTMELPYDRDRTEE